MTHTVVLVGCGNAKRDRYCAAKDLYTSTYFQKKRAYAEEYGDQWFILSAKHKLFDPDRWLAPYDKSMADLADPDQWARFVGGELHHQCRDVEEDVEVVMLAGRDYSDPLRSVLEELNFEYRCPFDATNGIGEQLGWLTERLDAASDQERVMTDGGQCPNDPDPIDVYPPGRWSPRPSPTADDVESALRKARDWWPWAVSRSDDSIQSFVGLFERYLSGNVRRRAFAGGGQRTLVTDGGQCVDDMDRGECPECGYSPVSKEAGDKVYCPDTGDTVILQNWHDDTGTDRSGGDSE
jgi:hypothetical protein